MPRQRRHTLYFLDEVRAVRPVFLDTEVDLTAVLAHRAAARAAGTRYSTLSYVLAVAARVLEQHPEANSAIRGGRRPRVARYRSVNGKITLDKRIDGHRVVVSTVLPELQSASLPTIQAQLDRFRAGDPATMPEFAPMRALHRLPGPLGRLAFRLGVRDLARRPGTMGTFAVTSLAHRPVDGFYSVGGTTITLGLGRTVERPVSRAGAVVVAPVMRLSLTFDHRVIDGAEAADVLAEVRAGLESYAPAAGGSAAGAEPALARGTA